MFEAPLRDQFTQGTIFSCGHAENYAAKIVHGLVITARCDAAQRKVPIYSFIPVVQLKDWILLDGADIALRRIIDDQKNTQINHLKSFDISEKILDSVSAEDIITRLMLPKAASDRRLDSKIAKFRTAQTFIERAEAALLKSDVESIKALMRDMPAFLNSTVKDLAGNKIMGHHLLREMPSLAEGSGDYVALLREVHHIPNKLAQKIIDGISREEWGEGAESSACCPVFIDEQDCCMPVAKLRSPWLEHLMQNWALLFSRIGVADVDATSVRRSLEGMGLEAA